MEAQSRGLHVIAEGELLVRRGQARGSRCEDEEGRRLVESALAGDRSAFDTLVETHWRKIASVIGRLLAERGEIEDILQETFVKAFLNLSGFRGEASVQTWLIRIAINIARNRQNGFWRKRVALTPVCSDTSADPRVQAETALLYEEWERTIHCALGKLPEKHRLPILLHFYEDLTGAEIAAILGWNESTVWSRIYAGIKELRKGLEPWAEI